MTNFAFSSSYYHSSTSPAPTPGRCLPRRSIKHSMSMTLRKGFPASPRTMRRTTWPWQSIFRTTLPSRTTSPGIPTLVISRPLHTLSISSCRSSSEQSSLPRVTMMRGIPIPAIVMILRLISVTTIWPLEESFQNYEQSPILFPEALTDGNYSNKVAGLVKLYRTRFRKMSPLDGIGHFECYNIISTWSTLFIDTSMISETHLSSSRSQNANGSKPKFCCSSSSLFNAVLHNSNWITPLLKSIRSFLPTIHLIIISIMSKTSFIPGLALEHYLAHPPY